MLCYLPPSPRLIIDLQLTVQNSSRFGLLPWGKALNCPLCAQEVKEAYTKKEHWLPRLYSQENSFI